VNLILDVETNGLLHELDRIHSLVLRDIDTGEVYSCADQEGYLSIQHGLDLIAKAEQLVGHNTLNFDYRALRKVYPGLIMRSNCDHADTLILSRVLWPELEPVDDQKFSHIASKYRGRHSLAAWGERLGVEKIKFQEEQKKDPDVDNVWEKWTPQMQDYCVGDTLVTLKLYEYLSSQPLDSRCHDLEHEFATIMSLQEEFGFPFNEKAAFALVNTLKARRAELDDELQEVFPPIIKERISPKTGKKLKTHITTFNPGSRQQVADRLRERYPEITFEKTEKGNTKVDDDVLELLGEKYPEAKILAEFQLLNKRLGQIADGKEAWLHHCRKYGDGRIHGGVKTNGSVSGRVACVSPNMAQVPSVGHAYGEECRALFTAAPGWLLVGTDAAGLELRALGAWLAYYDDGEYAKLVSNDGFDIHAHNAKLFGIYDGVGTISKSARDLSKRLIYALLYGAGAKKVGSVIDITKSEDWQIKTGRETIETFYKNLPAIKKLKDMIDQRITTRGYLFGIDGRPLQIRSRHSALNQLLQSTGAILMKKATCLFYKEMEKTGLRHGVDWGMCAFIHDELQATVKPEFAELTGKLAVRAIEESAEVFGLKCPFTGESKIGKNWAECH
jgi:DNA polymerase I-like protein with 3'-5' exonuclease and polymerase domains